MKEIQKTTMILCLLLLVSVNLNITPGMKSDEEWILVGENQAYQSIRQVLKAYAGQPIKIKLSDKIHAEESIEVNQRVIIEGALEEKTIVRGSGENDTEGARIFKVLPEGNLTLKNLIIEKGYVNKHPRAGAGIYNMGTCTVVQCIIQKNIGTYGVGIYSEGDLTIEDSIIQLNVSRKRPRAEDAVGLGCAGSGGGIKIQRGTFSIKNTIIRNNSAVRTGGGLKVSCPSKGNVSNTFFIGNTAKDFGGGLSINGEMTMNNSIVYNNTAHKGGGIHLVGTLNLTNSLLVNNVARDLELMLTNQNFTPELKTNDKNLIMKSNPSGL